MEVGCQRGIQVDTHDDWFGVVMMVNDSTRILTVSLPSPRNVGIAAYLRGQYGGRLAS